MEEKNNTHKNTIELLTSDRFKYKDMSENALSTCNKAKKKHRSEINLEDWNKFSFYKSDWCEKTLKNIPKSVYNITEEKHDNLSLEAFREKYESKDIPLRIIGGIESWKATECWNFDVRSSSFIDNINQF